MMTLKNIALAIVTFCLLSVIISSCSELKDANPSVQSNPTIHGAGFADKSSSNFHGVYLQKNGYDLATCKNCHGVKYDGGSAQKSCLTCHDQSNGPENCTTCHGTKNINAAPPFDLSGNSSPTVKTVGAHQVHVNAGSIAGAMPCSACHAMPSKFTDTGHIDKTPGAEVKFDTTYGLFQSQGTYSTSTASCANTYCHGNFQNGNARTMIWTDTSNVNTQCGTCHGNVNGTTLEEKALPKMVTQGGTHPLLYGLKCTNCHGTTVDSSMNFIDKTRHINGSIN